MRAPYPKCKDDQKQRKHLSANNIAGTTYFLRYYWYNCTPGIRYPGKSSQVNKQWGYAWRSHLLGSSIQTQIFSFPHPVVSSRFLVCNYLSTIWANVINHCRNAAICLPLKKHSFFFFFYWGILYLRFYCSNRFIVLFKRGD